MVETDTSRLVAERGPRRLFSEQGYEEMLRRVLPEGPAMSEAAMGGAGGLSPATGRCATAVELMQATHRAAARQLA